MPASFDQVLHQIRIDGPMVFLWLVAVILILIALSWLAGKILDKFFPGWDVYDKKPMATRITKGKE